MVERLIIGMLCGGKGFNSPQIFFPPISRARSSTTSAQATSFQRRAPSLPTSSSRMKSTGSWPKSRAHFSKPCRNDRSPSATRPMVEDAPIPLEPIVGLEDVRRLREAVRRVYYGRQDKRHRRSRSRHTLSRGCGNPGYGRTCGIRFIAASNFVSGAPCEPGASTPDLWQRISTPLH